jgi:hypothetical protein
MKLIPDHARSEQRESSTAELDAPGHGGMARRALGALRGAPRAASRRPGALGTLEDEAAAGLAQRDVGASERRAEAPQPRSQAEGLREVVAQREDAGSGSRSDDRPAVASTGLRFCGCVDRPAVASTGLRRRRRRNTRVIRSGRSFARPDQ